MQVGRLLLHLIYDVGSPSSDALHCIAEWVAGHWLLTFLLRQKVHASDTRFRGLPLTVAAADAAFVSMSTNLKWVGMSCDGDPNVAAADECDSLKCRQVAKRDSHGCDLDFIRGFLARDLAWDRDGKTLDSADKVLSDSIFADGLSN